MRLIPTLLAPIAVFSAVGAVSSALAQQPAQAPTVPAAAPAAPAPAVVGGTLQLVDRYDRDNNGRLDVAERQAAREFLATLNRGGINAAARGVPPPPAGPRLAPSAIKVYTTEPLYDPLTLRTIFLELEGADWERELAAFNNTDVDVPATLTVDGKRYPNVGIHFRGASSFGGVPLGYKHSLNLAMDFVDNDQRLGGYRTLNLLNAHADPSFLRTMLYQHIARQYIPAPEVNYMRLVINGESWGIYVNSQQFNTDMTQEWFGSRGGARWTVRGGPNARGGFNYLGDDPAPYKAIYQIRTRDTAKSWTDLINLCRVLTQTPLDQLEQAVAPILDIDATLKWLAVEKALMNSDGYWLRMSDYNLYQDPGGRFHIVSHDANETLREPESSPRSGPPLPSVGPALGVALDPFTGTEDPAKVLLNRLVAVPALRARYLGYLRDVAEVWMDWGRIGPIAERAHALIADDVRADTHKLYSTNGFLNSILMDNGDPGGGPVAGALPNRSLKNFFEQRRAYLLNHPDVKR
ncbi:MAG: CotH kinase family protein [Vicinamibacterales bacterium]